MDASKRMTETESAAGVPLDPFAVDFFGGRNLPPDETESFSGKIINRQKRGKTHKKSDWHKKLPQMTNAEAEFSYLLQNLPANLTKESAKIIAETLARYTFRENEKVRCSIISTEEVNLNETVNTLAKTSQTFLQIGCQPENTSVLMVLNNEFAKALIDLILGGKGAETGKLKELSPIEKTIIEFLAANMLSELNVFLGEDLLYLQSAKAGESDLFEPHERGAEVVFDLKLGDFKGIISLIAPQKFLKSLDRLQNPILTKKSDGLKLTDYEKIVSALDLRLQVGTTFLDADSLMFLEADDIVLIEQPQIALGGENIGANLQVLIGRGANFRLRGSGESINFGGELNFQIEEITSEEARRKFTPAKFKMDEKENELAAEETSPENDEQLAEDAEDEALDDQISPSLENVQVALRVEIAGNKISLRELQNLRAGQVIALGCSPNDAVRVVTDSNEEPVASGELIEIEGQLGVRLTKVFI